MSSGLKGSGLVSDSGPFRLGPIDLDVSSGETLVVTGPSGSGKTTLLRSLAGFLPLRSGCVEIDGEVRTGTPPEFRGLGYVPQGLGLLPHRTVEANIRFPMEIRGWSDARRRTQELVDDWGLEGKARLYPQELSGGEQQRVAMARAVAAEPRVLLWDEPLTALDAEARASLLEVIEEVRTRTRVAMLVVTHDSRLALDLADRILVLDQGRSVVLKTCPEILRDPGTPFTARFLGYENVFSRAALESSPSRLARWLSSRTGPEGIAFGAEAVRVGLGPLEGGWAGVGRHDRWTRAGAHVSLEVEGIPLEGCLVEGTGIAAGAGSGVRYASLDEAGLHPLGTEGRTGS